MSGHLDGPQPPPGPPDPPYIPGDLGAPSRDDFDRKRGGVVPAPDHKWDADRAVILEWAKFTRDESAGYWGKREEDVYQRLLAAADREAPAPDERLREALTRIERLVARWDAPIRHDVDDRVAYEKWAAVGSEAHKIAADALAAADREAPDEEEVR